MSVGMQSHYLGPGHQSRHVDDFVNSCYEKTGQELLRTTSTNSHISQEADTTTTSTAAVAATPVYNDFCSSELSLSFSRCDEPSAALGDSNSPNQDIRRSCLPTDLSLEGTGGDDDTQEKAGLSLLCAVSLLQQTPPRPLLTSAQGTATAVVDIAYTSKCLEDQAIAPIPYLDDQLPPCELAQVPHHYLPVVWPDRLGLSSPAMLNAASMASSSSALAGRRVPTSTQQQQNVVEGPPSEYDVLCGRGGAINKHPGNVMYRRVVDFNRGIYRHVSKRHRILVSRSIVQTIENAGGRFLQQLLQPQQPQRGPLLVGGIMTSTRGGGYNLTSEINGDNIYSGQWERIPFKRAVQKTSQALRERAEDEFVGIVSAFGLNSWSSASLTAHAMAPSTSALYRTPTTDTPTPTTTNSADVPATVATTEPMKLPSKDNNHSNVEQV